MTSLAADSAIVHWREHSPSSYSLKFDKLFQLNHEKFESRSFLSGGYNWRLIIYPRGNDKDNGSGYISSLHYQQRCSHTSSSSSITRKETNTLLFERSYALRTVWGLSKVLSLETFKDLKNGYIFDGEQCEFGVDVMVASPFTKWEVVSFNEKLTYPKFSWSVEKFSVLNDNVYVSNKVSIGGREWVLKLYPKGKIRAAGNWLSIFLYLADSETVLKGDKIYVDADLRVFDPRGSNHVTHTVKKWYKKPSIAWGWKQFVSISKLRESYLDEDTLSVEVEFKVVSTTKFSPTT